MKFLVMPGDGIGPEIVPVAVAALEALDRKLGLNIALEEVPIGFASLETAGNTFPDEALAKAGESDGVIMGPTDTLAYPPLAEGGRGPSAFMRTGLDLYANIRPAKTRPGVPSAVDSMDLVFARENTEGFYADRSMHLGNGEMMVTERFSLIEDGNVLRRDYEAIDPVFWTRAYTGNNAWARSDIPVTPYNCVELGGISNIRPE